MSRGIELFTSLAEDYARYRPGYPAEILGELARVCGLTSEWVVADIGSGTGNLARLFLEAGYQVIGIEPNREMREFAEHLLSEHQGFRSLDGTAENVPVEPNSVDLVAVGQALHWFDIGRARAEFRRILHPGGWAAVLWNDQRADEDAFAGEYRSLRRAWDSAHPAAVQAPSLDTGVDRLFGNAVPHRASFEHAKRFDLEGFLGRIRSTGSLPPPGAPGYAEAAALFTDLFNRHQCDGAVEFHYTAQLYVGRLDDA